MVSNFFHLFTRKLSEKFLLLSKWFIFFDNITQLPVKYIMETGKKCQLRIKTDWKNLEEAKEQCGNIAECTMFYEACNKKFYYCRASEYTEYEGPENIKIHGCSTLYIKGIIIKAHIIAIIVRFLIVIMPV